VNPERLDGAELRANLGERAGPAARQGSLKFRCDLLGLALKWVARLAEGDLGFAGSNIGQGPARLLDHVGELVDESTPTPRGLRSVAAFPEYDMGTYGISDRVYRSRQGASSAASMNAYAAEVRAEGGFRLLPQPIFQRSSSGLQGHLHE
jgi:hypothetical protein